jgi:hypothetical protein
VRITTTDKQRIARSQNARKSQGPKTEEGKTASSRNALKFGFFSRDPVIPGEDREEWDAFRGELLESLAPVGATQRTLAGEIVNAAWRLRRFPIIEAGIFTAQLYEEERTLAALAALRNLRDAEEAELAELESGEPEAEEPSDAGEGESNGLDGLRGLDVQAVEERQRELAIVETQAREASEGPETAMGRAFMRDARKETAFLKLGRYQAGLERSMWRNLQTLERLQAVVVKRVAKNPGSAARAKLQNDLTEGLKVTDRAA